jgi:hypothetical protein
LFENLQFDEFKYTELSKSEIAPPESFAKLFSKMQF